jgi:putative lipoic acid-binding regulatory protein
MYYLNSKTYICLSYFLDRMDKKTEEFYIRLKEELASTSQWPSEYLYKFIVPTDTTKILEVEKAFDNMGAVIKTTPSKTGKYTSVSINVLMQDPDQVVSKYLEVSTIEGIISF